MQLRVVAHDTKFNQPAKSQRVYPSKIAHDKTSAVSNIHVLCSNCPPPATTQARSLSPLSNEFVDDTLIQLIPFVHKAFSQLVGILDLVLYSVHLFL